MTPPAVCTPEDLVCAIPYLLGFQPEDCAILIAMSENQVALIERIDLGSPEHGNLTTKALIEPLARIRPDSALFVVYSQSRRRAVTAVGLMRAGLAEASVPLQLAIHVDAHNWQLVGPHGIRASTCGTLEAAKNRPIATRFITAGHAPLESRSAVERRLDPACDDWAESVVSILAKSSSRMKRWERAVRGVPGPRGTDDTTVPDDIAELWRTLIGDVCTTPGEPRHTWTPGEAAVLAGSLMSRTWRDTVLERLCPGIWDVGADALEQTPGAAELDPVPWAYRQPGAVRQIATALTDTLIEVCVLVPDNRGEPAAAFATVIAAAAWWGGDGVLARAAVERAQRLVPGYTLADLLAQLIDNGIPFNHRQRRGATSTTSDSPRQRRSA